MHRFKTGVKRLLDCDAGATLVEYAIAVLLAVTVGASVLIALGQQTNANLEDAVTELSDR